MTRLVLLDPADPARLDRMRPFLPEGWTLTTAASRQHDDQLAALQGADFAITGDVPVTAQMFATPGLKAVHKWGVGYDGIDLPAAQAAGVRVLRTTGSNAIAVAETTLGMVLALNRNLVRGHVGIQQGKWLKSEVGPSSTTLSGKIVGIIGMGSIGQALARLLAGFGCRILYTKRNPLPAPQESGLGVQYADLDRLLTESDVVTLNCELNASTQSLIDLRRLRQMKRDAILVNAARGGVLVEADLVQIMHEGHLRGAGIDVFSVEPITPDNPLLGLDRVILTPHLAALTSDGFAPGLTRMIRNLEAVLNDQPPDAIDILV